MSRECILLIFTIIFFWGCTKRNSQDEYVYFKRRYAYTLCRNEDGQWPQFDTVQQIPNTIELVLQLSDKGFKLTKDDMLIFQCDEYVDLYDNTYCEEYGLNSKSYRVCDDTLISNGPFFFQLPLNILEDCGPCSYSVWQLIE